MPYLDGIYKRVREVQKVVALAHNRRRFRWGILLIIILGICSIVFFNSASPKNIKAEIQSATVNNNFTNKNQPLFKLNTHGIITAKQGLVGKGKFVSLAGEISAKLNLKTADEREIETKITPDITSLDSQGNYEIKIQSNQFQSGKYSLKIAIKQGNDEQNLEQDFTWGVLALNTDQAAYKPGDIADIAMAVLDDYGNMACDAEVNLKITDPSRISTTLSTTDRSIIVSDECNFYGLSKKPDFYSSFKTEKAGTYQMDLVAITKNGTHEIRDNFYVFDEPDYIINRQGPTRVYPPVTYTMKSTVTLAQDKISDVTETVPASFNISEIDKCQISNENCKFKIENSSSGSEKLITWENISFKADEAQTFEYQFKVPDLSPEFYLLGPLKIGKISEGRQWQIAADANITISGTSDKTSCTGCVSIRYNGAAVANVNIAANAWTYTTTRASNAYATVWLNSNGSNTEYSTAIDGRNGVSNMAGMVLNSCTVTIGSTTASHTLTASQLGDYDHDNDARIMHTANSGVYSADPGTVCTANTATTSINSNTTVTVDSTASETITTGLLSITGSLTASGTPLITISGTGAAFTRSGTFTYASSKVSYTNATSATILAMTGTGGTNGYYDLDTNGAGTFTLGGATTVNNATTVTNGTLTTSGTNYNFTTATLSIASGKSFTANGSTITITGTNSAFTNAGTFTYNTSKVSYTNATSATILSMTGTGGTNGYYNLDTNGAGTFTLGGDIAVNNILSITSGNLTASTYTISIGGTGAAFTNGGTFTYNTSKVSYVNATSATILSMTGTGGTNGYYNLDTNGAGTYTLGGNVQVNNVLSITQGNLTASTYTITIAGTGSCFTNAGTFTYNTSKVSYTNGTSCTVLGMNGSAGTNGYYDLDTNGAGTYTLSAATKVNHNLSITQGSLVDNGNQISGNATGTFTMAASTNLKLGNSSATTFPTLFTGTNTTLNTTSTVTYLANADQNIDTTHTQTIVYGNLTLAPTLTAPHAYTFLTGAVTINGNFDINPGTAANLLTINMGGNITVAASKTTTIERTTSATSKLVLSPSAGNNYALSTGILAIAAGGTLDGTTNTATSTITITGTNSAFTNAGTFNYGQTKVTYTNATSATILSQTGTAGSNGYYNLDTNGAGTYTLGGDIRVNNVLSITQGNLTASTYTITIGGTGAAFTNAGTFTYNTSKVSYVNATSATILSMTGTGGTNGYYNLDTNGAGTYTLGGDVAVNNVLSISQGNLTASTYTITIGGTGAAFTNAGTFTYNTSKVSYVNATSATILSMTGTGGTNGYYNLDTNGAGTYTLGGDVAVNNVLSISAGNLTASTYTITIGGTGSCFTNAGTFTYNTSKVSYTNGTSCTVLGMNGSAGTDGYYDLDTNGAGVYTLSAATTVNNNLSITQGSLVDNGYQITGNATGTFTMATSTNLCLGATSCSASSTTATAFPSNFTGLNITLNAASTVKYMANSSSTTTIATTSTQTIQYGNLNIEPVTTAPRTFNFQSGAITINGNFTISPDGARADVTPYGAITMPATKTISVSRKNSAIDNFVVNGNITTGFISVSSDCILDGSVSSNTISLIGTSGTAVWTNSGTFNAGTTTISLDGTAAQTFTAGGTTSAKQPYNLTVTNASASGVTFSDSLTLATGGTFYNHTNDSKMIFHAGSTYTLPNMDVDGTTGHNVIITSDNATPGQGGNTQVSWVVSQATPTVTYATVYDNNATGSSAEIECLTSNGCSDGGNNTYWKFSSSISVSGNIYESGSESVTYGTAVDVTASVNDGTPITPVSSTGSYSINISATAGDKVVVYITNNALAANTFTISGSGTIANLHLYIGKVAIANNNSGSTTNANICTFTTTGLPTADALLDRSDCGTGDDLNFTAADELHLLGSYAPGANVTTQKLHIPSSGTYTGSAETLTLTGSGTSTARPLYIDTGSFTAGASSTDIFTGTAESDIESVTYNNLELYPASLTETYHLMGGTLAVNGNFLINNGGTLTVDWDTSDPTINLAGDLTLNTGTTWQKSASSTFTFKPTGTKTWTDSTSGQDLGIVSIASGSSTPKINLATNVSATTLSIAGSHELNANGSNKLTLTGTGTPFTVSGTFDYSTGTISYTNATSATIRALTGTGGTNGYYNLETNGAGTYTLGGATVVNNNLSITQGTFSTGSNYSLSVTGSYSNSGTFTANSSTVTFNAASGSKTLSGNMSVATSSTFYKVVFASTGTPTWSINDPMVVTFPGTAGASSLDIQAGTVTVGNGTGDGLEVDGLTTIASTADQTATLQTYSSLANGDVIYLDVNRQSDTSQCTTAYCYIDVGATSGSGQGNLIINKNAVARLNPNTASQDSGIQVESTGKLQVLGDRPDYGSSNSTTNETTLTDTTKTWGTNDYINETVRMTTGLAIGKLYTITANGTSTLTRDSTASSTDTNPTVSGSGTTRTITLSADLIAADNQDIGRYVLDETTGALYKIVDSTNATPDTLTVIGEPGNLATLATGNDIHISDGIQLGDGYEILDYAHVTAESGTACSSTVGEAHEGYVYAKAGSESIIQYADVCNLGRNDYNHYGLTFDGVNGANSNEGVTIDKTNFHNNTYGIYFENTTKNNNALYFKGITNNSITSSLWDNLYIDASNNNLIMSNNSSYASGYGLQICSSKNLFVSNIIYNNTTGIIDDCYGHNSYQSNIIYGNQGNNNGNGLEIDYGPSTQVKDNTIFGNLSGIYIYQSSNINLTSNSIYSNDYYGVVLDSSSTPSAGIVSIGDNLGGKGNNALADVEFYGTQAHNLTMFNSTMSSSTQVTGVTVAGAYVISRKDGGVVGATKVWGEYSVPTNNTETPQTESTDNYNYANNLWEKSVSAHGYSGTGTEDSNIAYDTTTGPADLSGGPYTYRVVTKTAGSGASCGSGQAVFDVYRNGTDTGDLTSGTQYIDSTGLRFTIECSTTPYAIGDTYTFVAYDADNSTNTTKTVTMMQDMDTYTVPSTQTLNMVGDSTHITTVSHNTTGGYNFVIQGTINANYYKFSYMGNATSGIGLDLQSGATISNLANGTYDNFNNATAGNTYVKVNGDLIGTGSPSKTFAGVSFTQVAANEPQYTVTETGGTPVAGNYWLFSYPVTCSGWSTCEASDSDAGDGGSDPAGFIHFYGLTVSGNIYIQGSESTTNSTAVSVSLSINNASPAQTLTGQTSSYSFTLGSMTTGDKIAVYIDGDASLNSNTITVVDGADIANLHLYINKVAIGNNNSGSTTNANICTFVTYPTTNDKLYDTTNCGTGDDLNFTAADELHLLGSYAPGANVTTQKLHIPTGGTYTGETETLILTGSGIGTARPLYFAGGTINYPPDSTNYTGISTTEIEAITYKQLKLQPSSNNPTYILGTGSPQTLNIDGQFDVGTISGPTVVVDWNSYDPAINIGFSGSLYINSGTWQKSTSATITFSPSGTNWIGDWSGNNNDIGNITLSGGSSTPEIQMSSDIKLTTLSIANGHIFNTDDGEGPYTLTLTGTGTPFSNSGTFTYSTGKVKYTGGSSTTITPMTGTGGTNGYYDLEVDGTGPYTLGGATVVNNDLAITSGTFSTGTNYALTITGSYSNAGTFTANSSTVTFNATSGTPTLSGNMTTATSSAFYKVVFDSGAGNNPTWSINDPMVVSYNANSGITDMTLNVANGTVTVGNGNGDSLEVDGFSAIAKTANQTATLQTYDGLAPGQAIYLDVIRNTDTTLCANAYCYIYVGATSGTGQGNFTINENTILRLNARTDTYDVGVQVQSTGKFQMLGTRDYTGTSEATTNDTTLTDSTKSGVWTTDSEANKYLRINSGLAMGQVYPITSNTNTVLTYTGTQSAYDFTYTASGSSYTRTICASRADIITANNQENGRFVQDKDAGAFFLITASTDNSGSCSGNDLFTVIAYPGSFGSLVNGHNANISDGLISGDTYEVIQYAFVTGQAGTACNATMGQAHEPYLYAGGGSETIMRYASACNLGQTQAFNAGITFSNVNGDNSNEGVTVDHLWERKGYIGVYFTGATSNNNGSKGISYSTLSNNINTGIYYYSTSANNLIDYATVLNNTSYGILLNGVSVRNNRVSNSLVYNNSACIAGGTANTIVSNIVRAGGSNMSISLTSGLVKGNYLYGNSYGVSAGDNSIILNNTFSGNSNSFYSASTRSNITTIGNSLSNNTNGFYVGSTAVVSARSINDNFGGSGNNTSGDIYYQNNTANTLSLYNTVLNSTTKVYNASAANGSSVISKKAEGSAGSTKIWGGYSVPAASTEQPSPQTGTDKFNYSDPLWAKSATPHGFSGTNATAEDANLDYDLSSADLSGGPYVYQAFVNSIGTDGLCASASKPTFDIFRNGVDTTQDATCGSLFTDSTTGVKFQIDGGASAAYTLNDTYLFATFDASGDGSTTKTVTMMQDTDTYTVPSTQTLNMVGDSTHITTVSHNTTGGYNFVVQGTINANYYKFSYMGNATSGIGLDLQSGATISNLANGTYDNFNNATAGNTYVKVHGDLIGTGSPSKTFAGVSFTKVTTNKPQYTVTETGGTPVAGNYWLFDTNVICSGWSTCEGSDSDAGDGGSDPLGYIHFGSSLGTVSGNIYIQGSEVTQNSTPVTVALSVNNAAPTTLDNQTGSYSFSNVDVSGGNILAVYISGDASLNADSFAIAGGVAISTLHLYINKVAVGSAQSGTNITNANICSQSTYPPTADKLYDSSDCGTGDALNFTAADEVHVFGDSTIFLSFYAPGANVTTQRMDIIGKYVGGSETLTLTGTGTGANRPLYTSGTYWGDYDGNSNTTIFTGNGNTDIPVYSYPAQYYYNNLYLQPTSGTETYRFYTDGTGLDMTGNLTVNNGANLTLDATSVFGLVLKGSLTINTGTTWVNNRISLDMKPVGTQTWTDNTSGQDIGDVWIYAGISTPKINLGSNVKATTVTVNSGHELNANGSNTLTLTGTGAYVFDNGGTFTYSTGKVSYTNATSATIAAMTGTGGTNGYYNLDTNGAGTYTLGGATVVNNNLSITQGTLSTGTNYALTVTGSYSNAGTFTANSSTVTFNATSGSKTLSGNMTTTPTASSFYKVVFDAGSGNNPEWTIQNPMKVSAANAADTLLIKNGTVTVGNGANDSLEINGKTVIAGSSGQAATLQTMSGLAAGSNVYIDVNNNASPAACANCIITVGGAAGTDSGAVLKINANGVLRLNPNTTSSDTGVEVESTGKFQMLGSLDKADSVSDAADDTTLTDNDGGWTTNSEAGKYLRITTGLATGRIYPITSNTSTVLTYTGTATSNFTYTFSGSSYDRLLCGSSNSIITYNNQNAGRYIHDTTGTTGYLLIESSTNNDATNCSGNDSFKVVTYPGTYSILNNGDTANISDGLQTADHYEILEYAHLTSKAGTACNTSISMGYRGAYVWAKQGSETNLQYANVCNLGRYADSYKGLSFYSVDGSHSNEGVTIDHGYFHNPRQEASSQGGISFIYMDSSTSNNNTTNSKGIVNSTIIDPIWQTIIYYLGGVGIELWGNDNNISNNMIYEVLKGLYLTDGKVNDISDNMFSGGTYGIASEWSYNNTITNNLLLSNSTNGIRSKGSTASLITSNTAIGNNHGIWIESDDNILVANTAYGNQYGITIYDYDNYYSINGNQLVDNSSYANNYGLYFGVPDVSTLNLINENYGGSGENISADITFYGTELNTISMFNSTLASTTKVSNISSANGQYVISKKDGGTVGNTKVWGGYSVPSDTTETPQDEDTDSYNYTDNLWAKSVTAHGWSGTNATAEDSNLDYDLTNPADLSSGPYSYRAVVTSIGTDGLCASATKPTFEVYRTNSSGTTVDTGTATCGSVYTDSNAGVNLKLKIDGGSSAAYTVGDTYTFVAYDADNSTNTQKTVTSGQDGTTYTVSSGKTIQMLGQDIDNPTIFTRTGSGGWHMDVAGTINALYYKMSYLGGTSGANGLDLQSTATVTNLAGGVFDNFQDTGGSTDTYIKVHGDLIGTGSPSKTFADVGWTQNGSGAPEYSVTEASGTPVASNYWLFDTVASCEGWADCEASDSDTGDGGSDPLGFIHFGSSTKYTFPVLTTDQGSYPTLGETISIDAEVDNNTGSNLSGTYIDYVIFIDANSNHVPDAGETYMTSGCAGSASWVSGDYTFQKTSLNVNAHSFATDIQSCTNSNFPQNTTYTLYGKWWDGGSTTYATNYTTFTSVPTLSDLLFMGLVGCAIYLGIKRGGIRFKRSTKFEILNPKQIQNPNGSNSKQSDSIEDIEKPPPRDMDGLG